MLDAEFHYSGIKGNICVSWTGAVGFSNGFVVGEAERSGVMLTIRFWWVLPPHFARALWSLALPVSLGLLATSWLH